jgi:hypothetical protein
MRVRALLLLALMLLGGCSTSGPIPDWISDDVAGPEPTNYRFIVASGLDIILGAKDTGVKLLEISNPRRVDVAKGATWMVCIKSLSYPARQPRAYYAVFIQREKIVNSRISVGTDQCQNEPYTPFEWSVDINNPMFR